MNKLYLNTPVYTGDVSGVCSALYELGGLCVIHDPSGCNSTYNTHDETRWYHKDSLIFISGLSQKDAVLGNDEKFIDDILDATRRLSPKFIAICNSPIPYITGCDFNGIIKILKKKTGLPCFYVEGSGLHDYLYGERRAYLELLKSFSTIYKDSLIKDRNKDKKIRLGILGMTPLDYSNDKNPLSLIKRLKSLGFEISANLSFNSSYEDIFNIFKSDLIIVPSSAGILAAKFLYEKFQIPYIVGAPIFEIQEDICRFIKDSIETGFPYYPLRKDEYQIKDKTVIIGECVRDGSIRLSLEKRFKKRITLISPFEENEGLLRHGDLEISNEREIKEYLKDADFLIADPMYAPLKGKNTKHIKIPHFAYSGRIYYKDMMDFFSGDLFDIFTEGSGIDEFK